MSDQSFKMRAAELFRCLKAVSLAASRDMTRPHMASVQFDASAEIVVTATDGHWAARWRCEPIEAPLVPCRMLVDIEDIDRLIPLLQADAETGEVVVNVEDGVVDFADGTVLAMKKISIEPPDVDKVWPTSPLEGVPYVGFMTELLVRASKCFKAAMGQDVAVRFQFREAEGPITVYADACEELAVLLMPAIVEKPSASAPETTKRQTEMFPAAGASAP